MTKSLKDFYLKLPWASPWLSTALLLTSTTATGHTSHLIPPTPAAASPLPFPRSEFYSPSLHARVREEYLNERSHLRNTGIKTSRIHHGRFISRSPSDGPALDPEGHYRSVLSPRQVGEIQSKLSDPANLSGGTRLMETRTHPGHPSGSSHHDSSGGQNVLTSFRLFV